MVSLLKWSDLRGHLSNHWVVNLRTMRLTWPPSIEYPGAPFREDHRPVLFSSHGADRGSGLRDCEGIFCPWTRQHFNNPFQGIVLRYDATCALFYSHCYVGFAPSYVDFALDLNPRDGHHQMVVSQIWGDKLGNAEQGSVMNPMFGFFEIQSERWLRIRKLEVQGPSNSCF